MCCFKKVLTVHVECKSLHSQVDCLLNLLLRGVFLLLQLLLGEVFLQVLDLRIFNSLSRWGYLGFQGSSGFRHT